MPIFPDVPSSGFRSSLDELEGFRVLERQFEEFADGETTPSVLGWSWFKASNTAATTITAFLDAVSGQEITLVATNGNTTVQDALNGSNIQLSGGADFTMSANDVLRLIYDGTNWFEVSRSVN